MEIVVRDYSGEDYDEVNRILKETCGYEKSKNRDTKSYPFKTDIISLRNKFFSR